MTEPKFIELRADMNRLLGVNGEGFIAAVTGGGSGEEEDAIALGIAEASKRHTHLLRQRDALIDVIDAQMKSHGLCERAYAVVESYRKLGDPNADPAGTDALRARINRLTKDLDEALALVGESTKACVRDRERAEKAEAALAAIVDTACARSDHKHYDVANARVAALEAECSRPLGSCQACDAAEAEAERLQSTLADRDATIARLTAEADGLVDVANTACSERVKAEARATTLEAECAAMRHEVHLRTADAFPQSLVTPAAEAGALLRSSAFSSDAGRAYAREHEAMRAVVDAARKVSARAPYDGYRERVEEHSDLDVALAALDAKVPR